MSSPVLAAIFALAAAAAWGSGDFTGGMVTRRIGPFLTVLISYSVGLAALVIVALARHEAMPPYADLVWGAAAGISGMIGLGFLLRGFSTGHMGIIAPVSAVLATAVPVIFTALTEGLPSQLQLSGFGVALASIWLLSRPETTGARPAGLGMALLAGLGFGAFFTMLGQIGESAVFWPLVSGRLVSCVLMAAYALAVRKPIQMERSTWRLVSLAGLFDVSGNLFFLLAIQNGRLDVTSVLASLYPAVTAILARLVAAENISRIQAAGVVMAVLAIVMITL